VIESILLVRRNSHGSGLSPTRSPVSSWRPGLHATYQKPALKLARTLNLVFLFLMVSCFFLSVGACKSHCSLGTTVITIFVYGVK